MFIAVGDVSLQISQITHIRKSGDSLTVYFSGGEKAEIPAEHVEAFWTKLIAAENSRSLRIE
jgi:hypothetical protein